MNSFEETIKADAKSNRQELSEGLKSFEARFSSNIIDIRDTIEKQLKAIREDNTQQLSEMRKTVDEKSKAITKRLRDSCTILAFLRLKYRKTKPTFEG